MLIFPFSIRHLISLKHLLWQPFERTILLKSSCLRDRLAELEAEIERLTSSDDGDADRRIAILEKLLEEKKESERRLLTTLSEMQTRLDDQTRHA